MIIPSASAVSSSISVTIKILEVSYQLKAVDEQTADLLSTTSHVDIMVQEARRLRRLKASLLSNSESNMIDKVISDTEDALRAVAKLVEPCRVDKDTKNSIKFGHRVLWVFRDNPNVRDKHQKLQVCHQSLTIAFNCLYSKDVVVIAPSPEGRDDEQPPPYDPHLKELLDWTNRRKGRKSVEEREGPTNESSGLSIRGLNPIPAAGPSSPCLLPIPLKDDGSVSSVSSDGQTYFESPALPSSDGKASKSLNSLHNDSISPTTLLPEVDRSPFATMLAPYSFPVSNDKDSPQSSKPLSQSDPRMAWLESSRHSYDPPEPTTTLSPDQPPLRTKSDSNIHSQTAYSSKGNNILPGGEDFVATEGKATNGAAKRAGRSWLAYHATRSGTGHNTG